MHVHVDLEMFRCLLCMHACVYPKRALSSAATPHLGDQFITGFWQLLFQLIWVSKSSRLRRDQDHNSTLLRRDLSSLFPDDEEGELNLPGAGYQDKGLDGEVAEIMYISQGCEAGL